MNRTEIESIGEFGLIEHLTENHQTNQKSTILGIGDDAAVLNFESQNCVLSTDLLIEGIHFDLMYTPLKHLGYKAVSVNVSDICAMMATPSQITISIAVSNKISVEALEEFYEGVYAACKHYNIDLIGGDTTSSNKGFMISVTAIGILSAGQPFISRKGAQMNDLICVSGDLGASFVGLQLLEREKRVFIENPKIQPDLQNKTHIIGKILKPEARIDITKWLKEQHIQPHAMMDVSDGLSSDILHICKQSKVGCVIYEDKIPIHPETHEMAQEFNLSPSSCALNGGEDYELLFTISQTDYEKIVLSEKISVIGYICEENEGKHLISTQGTKHLITAQGWKAF